MSIIQGYTISTGSPSTVEYDASVDVWTFNGNGNTISSGQILQYLLSPFTGNVSVSTNGSNNGFLYYNNSQMPTPINNSSSDKTAFLNAGWIDISETSSVSITAPARNYFGFVLIGGGFVYISSIPIIDYQQYAITQGTGNNVTVSYYGFNSWQFVATQNNSTSQTNAGIMRQIVMNRSSIPLNLIVNYTGAASGDYLMYYNSSTPYALTGSDTFEELTVSGWININLPVDKTKLETNILLGNSHYFGLTAINNGGALIATVHNVPNIDGTFVLVNDQGYNVTQGVDGYTTATYNNNGSWTFVSRNGNSQTPYDAGFVNQLFFNDGSVQMNATITYTGGSTGDTLLYYHHNNAPIAITGNDSYTTLVLNGWTNIALSPSSTSTSLGITLQTSYYFGLVICNSGGSLNATVSGIPNIDGTFVLESNQGYTVTQGAGNNALVTYNGIGNWSFQTTPNISGVCSAGITQQKNMSNAFLTLFIDCVGAGQGDNLLYYQSIETPPSLTGSSSFSELTASGWIDITPTVNATVSTLSIGIGESNWFGLAIVNNVGSLNVSISNVPNGDNTVFNNNSTIQGYTVTQAADGYTSTTYNDNLWTFTTNHSNISSAGIIQQLNVTTHINVILNYFLIKDVSSTLLYYNNATNYTLTGHDTPAELTASGWVAISFVNSATSMNIQTTVQQHNYFGMVYTNNNETSPSTINVYNIPNTTGECFVGNTLVLMANNKYKQIKDIRRGDVVLEDIGTRKTNVVARLYKKFVTFNCNKIPKKLIGNNEEIICTNHPIWCNNDNNRIFPKDIPGVKSINVCDYLYDIQFEDEGTFYANRIKVDSLPPNATNGSLPKELYFNKTKYTEYILLDEDDPIRNKPLMTKHAINYMCI